LGLDRPTLRVGPEILHGIEINPLAAELARTTIWIGDIQWGIKNALYTRPTPILRKLDSIECRDAVLTPDGREAEWPEVDFIVGNPPFLGGKLLRKGLGDDYVESLFAAYDGRVPAEADLVCYWFSKGWRAVGSGRAQSVGLVSTNSIRGGANRRVLEPVAQAGAIFEAWSDQPWTIDGAAVRVSLVCFRAPRARGEGRGVGQAGGADEVPHAEEGATRPSRSTRAGAATSSFETPAAPAPQDEVACRLDGVEVETINADLSAQQTAITNAVQLVENAGRSFQGPVLVGEFSGTRLVDRAC
jgi:hypothetical protein